MLPLNKSLKGLTLSATAVAALVAGLSTASAQMDTVTVQARATEQAVRDIPVAITAISEEVMDNYGVRNLKDIAALSPSVEINRVSSGSGAEISIRGISSSPGSIGIESSVAIVIDGVYYPQSRVIHEGLFDAGQVAIMKGPQSLYFGKNATAGVISVTTNDPGDELEILGKVGYETKSRRWLGEAILSTPINDKVGIRLALTGTKMNRGFMTNDATDSVYTTFLGNSFDAPAPESAYLPRQEMFGARLTLKGTPNDVFTYRIKASYVNDEVNNANITELFECSSFGLPLYSDRGELGQAHAVGDDGPTPLLDVNCAKDRVTGQSTIPPEVAATSVDLNRFGGENGEQYKSYNVTGDFAFDFENVYWQTIANWHKQNVGWVIDCDSKNAVGCFASEYSSFENFSLETRAATKFDGSLNAVFGVYYQKTKRDWRQEVIFAGAQNTDVVDPANEFIAYDKVSGSDGETISAYGEIIWDITEELQLTGGARYIWEKKDSFFTQPYVHPAFYSLFVEGRVLADDSAFDDLIPEVTLRYQPNDDLTFWVAYKQGFKSGGFDNGSIDSTLNADPISDITFKPEHVEGAEAGVKANLLGGSLNLEFDVYHYNFTDLQLNFFNSDTFAYRTLNAGGAKTTGAEIQINWLPEAVEGLMINFSLAYNDAHYSQFEAPCYSGQTPALGCPEQEASLKVQTLDGVSRNMAPKWAGKLGFDYSRPFGNGLQWGLSGNMKFKSEYLLSSTNSRLSQDGYVQVDAAVRIGDQDGNWQFAVIGRNLTNQYVLLNAAGTPSTGGGQGTDAGFESDYYGASLDPRTIEFELSFRF